MNNPQTPQETWRDIASRYEDDKTDERSECFNSFCNLVRRIAASEYAKVLFASRSHDILVITPIGEWPKRCKLPFISIAPITSEIVLKYWLDGRLSKREIHCPIETAWRNLEFLIGELLQEAQNGGVEAYQRPR